MKEISRKITVDLSRRGGTRQSFAVQNDKGTRNLRISLTDDGSPYRIGVGTVAALNYKRPDGICGAQSASVVDGDVCVTLQAPAIGAIGNTVCTVSLFDGDGNKLTSSEFSLDVSEEIYSGEALDETPEYTLLDGVFSRLAEFETREAKRATAEEKRESAEAERKAIEAGRKIAESERCASETERQIAESERASAEENRELSEALRESAEDKREQAEQQRILAEAERGKTVNANLGVGGFVTLSANAWTGENTQSVVISGLRENDLVIFYPSSERDNSALAGSRVFISPDSRGETVTCTAKKKPVEDISLAYFIIRGRSFEEV